MCAGARASGWGRQSIKTFATTTRALLQLREWLVEQRVAVVGMEATGDYWKPVYYLLEDAVDVQLLNAAHMHNVPGRKTDVCDSAWIARLVEHELVRASFVPPPPIRRLRNLTRYRAALVTERTREKQRMEKLLEDAGIKLSVFISDNHATASFGGTTRSSGSDAVARMVPAAGPKAVDMGRRPGPWPVRPVGRP